MMPQLVSTTALRYEAEGYQGESAALIAGLSELAIVYQNYFLREIIAYFTQLFQPPVPVPAAPAAAPAATKALTVVKAALPKVKQVVLGAEHKGSRASEEDAGAGEDDSADGARSSTEGEDAEGKGAGGVATPRLFVLKLKVRGQSERVLYVSLNNFCTPCVSAYWLKAHHESFN